jgi:signal transduction histidine kinase
MLSIRLKLTLVFSLLTFVFGSSMLLALNLTLDNYLRRDIPPAQPGIRIINRPPLANEGELSENQRQRLREIRLSDLRELQQFSALLLLPLTALSFSSGYLLSGRILKPIKDLSRQMNSISINMLGEEIPYKDRDEVGEVIASFNLMSKRLKLGFDEQSQFVQDAAHELRTPVTILQAALETSLQDKNIDRAELLVAVQDALSATRRLSQLSEDLLDTAKPISMKEKIDLAGLLRKLVEINKPRIAVKKINLELNLPENSIWVRADSIRLERAVSNIIDNAIKYCDQRVVIKLEQGKLEIANDGAAIPVQDSEKIFDRFYRSQKRQEGNGLGLSIARSIIEHHGGSISLGPAPKGYTTCFRIVLPVANGI